MDDHKSPVAPALLGYRQAGEFLGGVSRSTMKALVAKGQIRSITIGRRRLYPLAELERYVADRIAAAASE